MGGKPEEIGEKGEKKAQKKEGGASETVTADDLLPTY